MSTVSGTEATLDLSPKPPAPLYPDVPWWAILVTAFVFATVGVLVTIYAMKPGNLPAGTFSLGSVGIDTLSYIPHILLLFGVLMDMFTLQGVWSIPSLIGILSIFANYVFQYFWKGIDELVKTTTSTIGKGAGGPSAPPSSTDTTPPPQSAGRKQHGAGKLFDGYKGCSVQGFEGFRNPYAPQTLVVTATVFAFYCFDLIGNRGWINSIPAILGFVGAYVGQTVVIDFQNPAPGGCDHLQVSTMSGALRALFEGIMFGGIGYGFIQTYTPTRLPSSTISPFPRKSVSDLTPGPDGKMYDSDGYPYLVLPNGQAVPDVSDAKSRAAFGKLAGSASGSIMSLASDCPGVAAGCPKTI
jgi:hypothetical protein